MRARHKSHQNGYSPTRRRYLNPISPGWVGTFLQLKVSECHFGSEAMLEIEHTMGNKKPRCLLENLSSKRGHLSAPQYTVLLWWQMLSKKYNGAKFNWTQRTVCVDAVLRGKCSQSSPAPPSLDCYINYIVVCRICQCIPSGSINDTGTL